MSRPPVSIRMYRGLLGDCFLLTIGDPKADRDKRAHILIDCGVLQQVPGEVQLMEAVAEDLRATVGDYIDLLVVTHEHWDHISGFAHARAALVDTLEIKRLWLAWTERRGDAQADLLRSKSTRAKEVVARLAELPGGRAATGGLEDFTGAKAGKLRSTDVIPALIARASKTGGVDYLEPGQVIETPEPLSLRVNVLGPPRRTDRIAKDMPTKGAPETYLASDLAVALSMRYAMADALDSALDAVGEGPFDRAFRYSPASVDNEGDATAKWLRERYHGTDATWRAIDDDWMGAGGALALKLDSDTNNTSLVLAFEMETGGDVLLFAADAQVGNWLSWHDQTYPHPAPAGRATASATDLLGRTVFYKVGHHASHNATLEALGLELMTHPDLCAMIPVVEAEARREKNGKAVHRGWNMPYPDLYARLLALTQGRLLRGDAEAGREPAPGKKVICTDESFLSRVKSTNLYHELHLP